MNSYTPLKKFHIFDGFGAHVGTLLATNFEEALTEAYQGYNGKLSKSYITEHLLDEAEVMDMEDWAEQLKLALSVN